MKYFATLLLTFLLALVPLSPSAHAQTRPPRLKICKNDSTGEIQARRGCRGSFTNRLSAENLVTGKIINLTASGSTIETSNANVISVIQNSLGVYTVSTTIPDVRNCSIVASPLNSGAFTVSAYANLIDTSQIFVDTFYAPDGGSFDVTYHLIAYCP